MRIRHLGRACLAQTPSDDNNLNMSPVWCGPLPWASLAELCFDGTLITGSDSSTDAWTLGWALACSLPVQAAGLRWNLRIFVSSYRLPHPRSTLTYVGAFSTSRRDRLSFDFVPGKIVSRRESLPSMSNIWSYVNSWRSCGTRPAREVLCITRLVF
jgi:hypothetical protein